MKPQHNAGPGALQFIPNIVPCANQALALPQFLPPSICNLGPVEQ